MAAPNDMNEKNTDATGGASLHAPVDLPPVPTADDTPPAPAEAPEAPQADAAPADDTAPATGPAPAADAAPTTADSLDATQLNPAMQAAQAAPQEPPASAAGKTDIPPAPASDGAAWLENQPKKKVNPVLIGGIAVAVIAVIAIAFFALSGGAGESPSEPAAITANDDGDKPAAKDDADEPDQEEPATKDDADDGDTGTIHAGTVDTSSKYSFSVESALIGTDEYTDTVCVLLVGTFTNESDETVSFESTLDAEAVQGGYTLTEAYLSGASEFNYGEIAPGQSIPVFIAWELVDGTSDVSITVTDMYHYAEAVVFEQTYTIDELVANSNAYVDSLEGFSEGMDA